MNVETELKAGFYNAVLVDGEPDRTYNADDVNDFLEGLVSSQGIYATISTACQVVAGTGLQVIVKEGKGIVDNHWFKIESDIALDLETADVILDRIDNIIVRHSSTDRNVKVMVLTGTPASTPEPPTIQRTTNEFDIVLAQVLVKKNSTQITTSNITDTRSYNSICGWITGLINQIDTTTLFNQYEAAQIDFINEKTTQYEEWETTQKGNFDDWFNNVQDEVRATSLYREYQALYTTSEKGEQVISIPSSINYIHNSLDVLNVYINGMRLLKDVEYTINSDGGSINLAYGLDVIGTDIEFVNKKAVEGTVAESTVLRVETLEEKVNDISQCSYIATGTDDNINLSNIVRNFLDGTGSYSGVADNASLKIEVVGALNASTLIDSQMAFDFHSTNNTNRRVIVDFGNATIPALPTTSESIDLMVMIGANEDVIIENANIKIDNFNANTIYGFHGAIARNAKVIINNSNANTIYGLYNSKEVSNSEITINGENSIYGVFAVEKVIFNNINVSGGVSIQGEANSLIMGNFVNSTPVPNGATEIGTILV